MTSIKLTQKDRDLIGKAKNKTYVDETISKKKRKQRRAKLEKSLSGVKIPDKKAKPEGHHEKRMESLRKQLRTGTYEKPEFSSSIPDSTSTVASTFAPQALYVY